MSCKFCKNSSNLLIMGVISPQSWGWGGNVKITVDQAKADQDYWGVFIDRGYLRLADVEDCQCLDHGYKIKIKFCPFCGEGLS